MPEKERMRLDKALARMGIGTRSELKRMAREGRITVNGEVVRDSGTAVWPERDVIEVDGERVRYREHVYIMLNKPRGVVSATEDRRERTVLDLIAPELKAFRPFPAGRLDKDVEGLLLITSDGELAHGLLSPRRHVPKTYRAEVDGPAPVGEEDIRLFQRGVELDDGYVTMPAELKVLHAEAADNGFRSSVELTICEGKYHQVKRMFEAVGKKVVRLKRIRMGPLALDPALPAGGYRELSDEETALLKEIAKGGKS